MLDPSPPPDPDTHIREVRRKLEDAARQIQDEAAQDMDWEAQSLLATTAEVLRCLDEAFERYERRHRDHAAVDGPGSGSWNRPPDLHRDIRA